MWPRSLFGRTALIIAAALLIAQSTFIFLVHLSFRPLMTSQLAGLLLDNAHLAASAVHTLPPGQYHNFVAALKPGRIDITTAKPSVRPGKEPRLLGKVARQVTRAGYPTVTSPRPAGVGFTMQLDPTHWLTLLLPEHLPALPWPRLGFLGAGLAVTTIGALLLVRRVNRPLAALANAAASFGKGGNPPPLPVDGPTEIAHVCAAFNHMTAEARRHERDRALLLAGVSHDLRTPLARLRVATELLTDNTDLQKGMIEDIEEMDGILAEFLAYVRHGVEESPIAGDLNALIREVVDRYTRRGNTIRFHARALPIFSYRPLATSRLVTNLLDNAVRHAGGAITVTTRGEPGWAEIRIDDRGPGLTEEQRTRLAEGSVPAEPHRRGLGLVIAKRITEAQGGTLSLDARGGGGLSARVRLPMPVELFEGASRAHAERL